VLAVGRILNALASLATYMILSRLLTQANYGTYQQVWLVYLTIMPLLAMGLPASITFFIPQKTREDQKTIIVQTTILLMLSGLILSLVTFVGSSSIAQSLSSGNLSNLLRCFFLFPIFSLPLLFNMADYHGRITCDYDI